MHPPEDAIPADAWADVVEQLGDLVVVEPYPVGRERGSLRIGFRLVDDVIKQVRNILEAHGLAAEPWCRDPDWWRGG